MVERILSHLHLTVGDRSKSLRTVIPHNIVDKMHLTVSDILEWVVTSKGDILVKSRNHVQSRDQGNHVQSHQMQIFFRFQSCDPSQKILILSQ
jgi:bifunctional DNA-binding transcriptional regulator/antitoxin component of YhaV-PrlF toxin-antitoxin module